MKEKIETIIDRLLDYVNTMGTVPLEKASRALALQSAQTEKLALLLEENGLLEVKYTLVGIQLSSKKLSEAEMLERQKKAGKQANKVFEEARDLEHDVMTSENLMKFFEKDLERRIARAETLLEELEAKGSFTKQELDFVKLEVDAALGQLAAFSQEINEVGEKENEFHEKLLEFKKKLEALKARRIPEEGLAEKLRSLAEELAEKIAALFGGLTRTRPKQVITKRTRARAHTKMRKPPVTFLPRKRARVLETRSDGVREHYWIYRKKRRQKR